MALTPGGCMKVVILAICLVFLSACGRKEVRVVDSKNVNQHKVRSFKSLSDVGFAYEDADISVAQAAQYTHDILFDEEVRPSFEDIIQFTAQMQRYYSDSRKGYLTFLAKSLELGNVDEIEADLSSAIDKIFIGLEIQEGKNFNLQSEFYLFQYLYLYKHEVETTDKKAFYSQEMLSYFKKRVSQLSQRPQEILKRLNMACDLINDDSSLFAVFATSFTDLAINQESSHKEHKLFQRLMDYFINGYRFDELSIIKEKKQIINLLTSVKSQLLWQAKLLGSSDDGQNFSGLAQAMSKNFYFIDLILSQEEIVNLLNETEDSQSVIALVDEFYRDTFLKIKEEFTLSKRFIIMKMTNNDVTVDHPLMLDLFLRLQDGSLMMAEQRQLSRYQKMILDYDYQAFENEALSSMNKEDRPNRSQKYLLSLYKVLLKKQALHLLLSKQKKAEMDRQKIYALHDALLDDIKSALQIVSKTESLNFKLEDHSVKMPEGKYFLNPGLYSDLVAPGTSFIFHPLAMISGEKIKVEARELIDGLVDSSGQKGSGVIEGPLSGGAAPRQQYNRVRTESYHCSGRVFGRHCSGEDRFEHHFTVTPGAAPSQTRTGQGGQKASSMMVSLEQVSDKASAILLFAIGGKGAPGEQGYNSPLCNGENKYFPFMGRVGTVGTAGNHTDNYPSGANAIGVQPFHVMGGVSGHGGDGGEGGQIDLILGSFSGGKGLYPYALAFGGPGGDAGAGALCLGPGELVASSNFLGTVGFNGEDGQVDQKKNEK